MQKGVTNLPLLILGLILIILPSADLFSVYVIRYKFKDYYKLLGDSLTLARVFFFFLRAALAAFGSSQARGPIGAVYATATAMPDPTPFFNLHYSSWQHQSLTH